MKSSYFKRRVLEISSHVAATGQENELETYRLFSSFLQKRRPPPWTVNPSLNYTWYWDDVIPGMTLISYDFPNTRIPWNCWEIQFVKVANFVITMSYCRLNLSLEFMEMTCDLTWIAGLLGSKRKHNKSSSPSQIEFEGAVVGLPHVIQETGHLFGVCGHRHEYRNLYRFRCRSKVLGYRLTRAAVSKLLRWRPTEMPKIWSVPPVA